MSEQTPNTHTVVFPITLFARVLAGSEGTFIVTATPPKPGEDKPGVAVRPIIKIDDNGDGNPIAAALLREVSEMQADAALRLNTNADAALRTAPVFYGDTTTHTTVYAVSGDDTPMPVSVPLRPSLKPDDITADLDDAITEDAGEE